MNGFIKIIINWANQNNLSTKIISRDEEELKKSTELLLGNQNLLNIPSELFNLTNLKELWLGHNFLEILPSNIGNLNKLKKLSLSNNKLTKLPKDIIKLTELDTLALDTNPLELTKEQKEWLIFLKNKGCIINIDKDIIDLTNISGVNNSSHNLTKLEMMKHDVLAKIILFLEEIEYLELLSKIKQDGIEYHIDYLLNILVQFKKNRLIFNILNEIVIRNAIVTEIYFDEDAVYSLDEYKFFHSTLIHYAILEEESNIVELLLQNKKNMFIRDEKNRLPIEMALNLKSSEIINLFVKNKFELEYLKESKEKYIKIAIKNDHISFIKYTISLFDENDYNNFIQSAFVEDSSQAYGFFLQLLNLKSKKEALVDALKGKKNNIVKYCLSYTSITKSEYFQFLDEFNYEDSWNYKYENSKSIIKNYINYGIKNNYFDDYNKLNKFNFLIYAIKNSKKCLVESLLTSDFSVKNLTISSLLQDYDTIFKEIIYQDDFPIEVKVDLLFLLTTQNNNKFTLTLEDSILQKFIIKISEELSYISYRNIEALDFILLFLFKKIKYFSMELKNSIIKTLQQFNLKESYIYAREIIKLSVYENIDDELTQMVIWQNYNEVKRLLEDGANPNILYDNGVLVKPIILYLIKNKNLELVKLFVTFGVDTELLLKYAFEEMAYETSSSLFKEKKFEEQKEIEKKYEKIIKWLYKTGGTLKIEDANKLLQEIVFSIDNPKLINILLSFGADSMYNNYNTEAFYIAIERGHYKTIKLFLKNKKDVDEFKIRKAFNQAIRVHKTMQTVRIIYENYPEYIDINSLNKDIEGHEYGGSFFHEAVSMNQIHMVEFLYEKGADIENNWIAHHPKTILNSNYTPISAASSSGSFYCIKQLLQYDADMDKEDNFEDGAFHFDAHTPLGRAIKGGYFFSVKLLIDNGVNINFIDKNDNTNLHIAAENRDFEVFKLILSKINENLINKQNKLSNSPLHIAIGNYNSEEYVKLLIEKGADINLQNYDGYTPLMLLTKSYNININLINLILNSPYLNKDLNDGIILLENLIDAIKSQFDYGYPSLTSIKNIKSVINLLKQHNLITTKDVDALSPYQQNIFNRSAEELYQYGLPQIY